MERTLQVRRTGADGRDVLLIVCLGLGVTAAVVTLRWSLARVDALGRPRPFPMVSVAVPATAAMLCAVPVARHARLEGRLAEVASQLAGREVDVRCETVGEAWLQTHPERGFVEFGPDGAPKAETTITYDTCRALADWAASIPDRGGAAEDVRRLDVEQVIAVHVLTHEAMHMAGLVDEAKAECAAVQRDHRTATLLGASDPAARELSRRYLLEVYPDLPPAYRSAQCHPGGADDEQLENPPWT